MAKIRIKTKSGKEIERKAEVTDFIDNNGQITSVATVGNATYKVVEQDVYGAIFAAKWAW